MKECWVVDLGVVDYSEALALQEKLLELRSQGKIPDVLLLLEHPHTITMGRKSTEDMLRLSRSDLNRKGIQVVDINRGGKATYHGPGQVVGYAIRNIALNELDAHLIGLEDTMIKTVQSYDVEVFRNYEFDEERKKRFVGVWCPWKGREDKIGAIGIEIRKGVTMHGFALNINTDLSYFDVIDPCGFKDKGVISLKKILGKELDLNEAKQKLSGYFAEIFGYKVENKSYEELFKLQKQFIRIF